MYTESIIDDFKFKDSFLSLVDKAHVDLKNYSILLFFERIFYVIIVVVYNDNYFYY